MQQVTIATGAVVTSNEVVTEVITKQIFITGITAFINICQWEDTNIRPHSVQKAGVHHMHPTAYMGQTDLDHFSYRPTEVLSHTDIRTECCTSPSPPLTLCTVVSHETWMSLLIGEVGGEEQAEGVSGWSDDLLSGHSFSVALLLPAEQCQLLPLCLHLWTHHNNQSVKKYKRLTFDSQNKPLWSQAAAEF